MNFSNSDCLYSIPGMSLYAPESIDGVFLINKTYTYENREKLIERLRQVLSFLKDYSVDYCRGILLEMSGSVREGFKNFRVVSKVESIGILYIPYKYIADIEACRDIDSLAKHINDSITSEYRLFITDCNIQPEMLTVPTQDAKQTPQRGTRTTVIGPRIHRNVHTGRPVRGSLKVRKIIPR